MGVLILLKKGMIKQRGTVAGIFLLIFAVSFSLILALAVSIHSEPYVRREMDRLGYGDVTAWTGEGENPESLAADLESLYSVAKTTVQPLLFSGYSINGVRSDNEGQLMAYEPSRYPYRFINEELDGYADTAAIRPGEIYISPALRSSFGASVGDEVHFTLSRSGEEMSFLIGGYFEDPFMGSSMLDMKSFLVCPADFNETAGITGRISDFDRLAESGAMLHIFKEPKSSLTGAEFVREINTRTSLQTYTKFAYTDETILGFMLIQQKLFSGFLFSFAALLLIVSMTILGHSIASAIEQDSKDLAILKTLGYKSAQLRMVLLTQYGAGIAGGILSALLAASFLTGPVTRLTLSSTGLLMPGRIPLFLCLPCFAVIAGVLALYILQKTGRIARISPIRTISDEPGQLTPGLKTVPVRQKGLVFFLALRQISFARQRYAGVCIVAALLVFFVSAVGRMGAWLGPGGEGLMNAFSAASHDLGVQPMSAVNMDEIENTISSYAKITETYELAMRSVTVNGAEYTANIIDEPSRFHILEGASCLSKDEIVVTEFVAADLEARIGDSVTVSHQGRSGVYRVAGIYQCANETGANIGMNRDGYAKIGNIDEPIWCRHYILADSSRNEEIMTALQNAYRTEAAVHANSWSGLDGIVGTMRLLTFFMDTVVVLFIPVVIALTGSRLLFAEQRDMAILKCIGFTSHRLRLAFSLRFGITAAAGSVLGIVLSCALADPAITAVLRLFGISEFRTGLGLGSSILPAAVIAALFAAFAYVSSRRIKRVSPAMLIVSS